MRHVRAIALAALGLLLLVPASAYADATLFLGATTSPSNRLTKGAAIGGGLLILGFEFEYADTTNDVATQAPSLKTGMGNLLIQSPVAFVGIQPYFTVGGGGYREELGTVSNTGVAGNTGGGLKINLVGPVRLRVDYRVLMLRSALVSPAHRFYAGINLKF